MQEIFLVLFIFLFIVNIYISLKLIINIEQEKDRKMTKPSEAWHKTVIELLGKLNLLCK